MIRLSRHSERFAASGGMGARTTRRVLGAHTLGFWELFLRETLQNSWDARRSPTGPIKFAIDAWTAAPGQRAYLRDFLLTDPPPLLGLDPVLDDPALTFLVVSDGGTWGLSGPTRADIDPNQFPGARTDFVDLVRDTGRRANKGYAGGTYGFGKVVLCEASAVSTVVIYTRTMTSGPDGSRLIAMAIGNDEYTELGARYTGRHWWGNVDSSRQLAEPLRGSDADNAAFNLGIHKLIDGLTGTAILVVAPRSPGAKSEEGLQQITTSLANAAAEYAWPHMLPGHQASIDLRVTQDGYPVPVATPETDARLKVLAHGFMRCEELTLGSLAAGDPWPWHHRLLKSNSPSKDLGALAWRHTTAPRSGAAESEPRSQVALIRNPHFVVAYLDVPTDPSGRETFGVFLGAPELDGDYAASEPPTHDAWIPRKGVHFDPARRSRKQIIDQIKERPNAGRSRIAGGEAPGVVSIASALGILLDGQSAFGDPRILWAPPDTTQSGRDREIDAGPLGQAGRPRPPAAVPRTGGRQDLDLPEVKPSDTTASQETATTPDWTETAVTGQPLPDDDDETVTPRRYVRAPTLRLAGEPDLLLYGDTVAAEFPFTIGGTRNLEALTISGTPSVFIDGGKETEPPLHAAMPRVLAWRELSTSRVLPGAQLVLTQPITSKWSVLVSQLPDAAVGVDLVVESYE
jgi:hypothetical protein